MSRVVTRQSPRHGSALLEHSSHRPNIHTFQTIVTFLDKSRLATSRTQTTSSAPAPALTPATVAFATACKVIIDDLHSESGNPNSLRYLNARDDGSLQALAREILPCLAQKRKTLARYISDAKKENINVSKKTENFWQDKKLATEVLLNVLEHASKAEGDLDEDGKVQRAEFYKEARHAWEVALKELLIKVNHEVIGPYCLGTFEVLGIFK